MACASNCFDSLKLKFPSAFKVYSIEQSTSGGFDVSTGNVINTKTTATSTGLFDNYTERQIADKSLQETDIKLTDKVANLAIIPNVGDVITSSNIKYDISRIIIDPTNQLYEMSLRRRGSK